jgi:arylsulfatase
MPTTAHAVGRALLGLSLLGGTALGLQASERTSPNPNFLIILADDMGFSDAGCYGGEIETPNLDRLAAGGLRFTQFYSTARCWPSRTCLLTGYYAQEVRMDPPRGRLPAWTRVLPHYLRPLGYRNYHSGKWHLMGAPKPCADGGFDHSYCLEDHNRFFAPRQALLDDRSVPPVPEGTDAYVTPIIANHAVDFLKEHARDHASEPFLLYLAFTSPHFPLHAPADDVERYRHRYDLGWDIARERRWQHLRDLGLIDCALSAPDPFTVPSWNLGEAELFHRIGEGESGRAIPWRDLSPVQKTFQATKMAIHAAMIDRMDREIGRVLDQLRAMGIFENTVIFFASDNGASAEQIIRGDGHDPSVPPGSGRSFLCLGPGWSAAANTPFRRHKSWVHEGGISSPFIVHWPAGLAARGELRHTPGHFVDLLPTVLDLAKAGQSDRGKDAPPLPGRSLVPAFARDVPVSREYLYWHHLNNRALRVGDWKLVSAGGEKSDGAWELYDLRTDRAESKDLAPQEPAKVKELAELWKRCEERYRAEAGEGGR